MTVMTITTPKPIPVLKMPAIASNELNMVDWKSMVAIVSWIKYFYL